MISRSRKTSLKFKIELKSHRHDCSYLIGVDRASMRHLGWYTFLSSNGIRHIFLASFCEKNTYFNTMHYSNHPSIMIFNFKCFVCFYHLHFPKLHFIIFHGMHFANLQTNALIMLLINILCLIRNRDIYIVYLIQ